MALEYEVLSQGPPTVAALLVRILHNDTRPVPDFNVLSVDKLASFFSGLDVIPAIKNFRWPRHVAFSVEKIDPVMRQRRIPFKAGAQGSESPMMPRQIGAT